MGALKAGYLADIIAVPGDPLKDISVLKKVVFRNERWGTGHALMAERGEGIRIDSSATIGATIVLRTGFSS